VTDVDVREHPADLPEAGALINGKYEIIRVIGKGGMGVVYEAKHLRLHKRVALKMLRPAALHVADFKPRFEREARTAALLQGHHVARIFDVDVTTSGLPFMVMEYLTGKDLDAELQERGTLSVQEATGYVLQACIAMQEAHAAGIIHRDLKPANLFLTDEGGDRVVKVLDFGISKLTFEVDTHLTGTFATVGTPLYMSPEQVRSSRSVDARSDIWSLAVILFEALAGQPPFHGSMTATAAAIVADKTPSLTALRPDVPPELEAAILKALEKHPNRRYQDVESLMMALMPFGPGRIPYSSPDSAPGISPSSSPSLSTRISPVGLPRADWGSAAETMMIPDAERRSARPSPVRKLYAKLPMVGLALSALVVGGILAFRGPTGAAPIARAAGAEAPPSVDRAPPEPSPVPAPPEAQLPASPHDIEAMAAPSPPRPAVSVVSQSKPTTRPPAYPAGAASTPRAPDSHPSPAPSPQKNPVFL
jgi:serine/threonine-protein kinase